MKLFTWIIIMPFIFIFSGCNGSSSDSKGNDMLIKEWQTFALGRMLVDLPLGAIVDEKEEMIEGIFITWRKDLNPQTALEEVTHREKEHKNFPPLPERPPCKYIATIDLVNGGKGIMRWADQGSDSYSQYVANLDCYFITDGKPKVVFYPYKMTKSMLEPAKQRMIAFAPTVHGREEDEFPNKPGFCFDGGFVDEPDEWRTEISAWTVRLPAYPGMKIIIVFQAAGRELESTSSDHMDLAKKQTDTARTIRSRKVKLGDGFKNAKELCMRNMANYGDNKEYSCVLAADGDPKRLDRPNIYIRMTTGDFFTRYGADWHQVFHSDNEFLDLWEALIKRVRPRPVEG
ncbi:hypothetical protein C4J81_18910 (plasmid) [Deltaproteobacteria bacterium Smac51]|nr:hypothetical protein C4J81_18910 [Deltaproteobacteria bacterium Smac51]